ncbi:hypothetical protein F5878DRAFT_647368 [Lentinula raphanica]|uniref:Uncharacterized protein n=1 Tax=Lentinula raphanica TaxID=153919 RepID=A0AA38NWD1_9AGAR|nr:hypothetical protein F5878DRAFT_647368 [Lentinula raphanica]
MVQSSRCVVIIFFAFLANSNVTQVVTDPVTSPRRAEIQQYPPRLVRPVTTVYQYIPNVLLGDGQPKTHEIEARLPAEWIRKLNEFFQNIGRLSKDQRVCRLLSFFQNIINLKWKEQGKLRIVYFAIQPNL